MNIRGAALDRVLQQAVDQAHDRRVAIPGQKVFRLGKAVEQRLEVFLLLGGCGRRAVQRAAAEAFGEEAFECDGRVRFDFEG